MKEKKMEIMLGEHGEAVFYGIVGILMVMLICTICAGKWILFIPEYKNTISRDSEDFIAENKEKFPKINGDEVIFADYKGERFDYKDFFTAIDADGTDITEKMKVYGNVDVLKKGVYKIRCVVVSESSLTCTKYVNVIVE